jgi:hypothetical protein
MNRIYWISFFVAVSFLSCRDKYDVNRFHSIAERDSLLTDIITYVYMHPQDASWQTRFDKKYRDHYANQLKKFSFEKYFINDEGVHFYYVIRPARSAKGTTRGVGGTFKMNAGKIMSFREVFNTPVGTVPELQKRGDELFSKLVRSGNIDDYVKHPDYVEWPNNITYYDTLQYQWLVKPGI